MTKPDQKKTTCTLVTFRLEKMLRYAFRFGAGTFRKYCTLSLIFAGLFRKCTGLFRKCSANVPLRTATVARVPPLCRNVPERFAGQRRCQDQGVKVIHIESG
jgi:hypothetical protein